MIADTLIDKLVGSAYWHRSEEKIKPAVLKAIQTDYIKISSFWGKACFLLLLELSDTEEVRIVGKKIKRELMHHEKDVYVRHIEPLYAELKRAQFTTGGVDIISGIKETLYHLGENEFLALCRALYNAGDKMETQLEVLKKTTAIASDKVLVITSKYK